MRVTRTSFEGVICVVIVKRCYSEKCEDDIDVSKDTCLCEIWEEVGVSRSLKLYEMLDVNSRMDRTG